LEEIEEDEEEDHLEDEEEEEDKEEEEEVKVWTFCDTFWPSRMWISSLFLFLVRPREGRGVRSPRVEPEPGRARPRGRRRMLTTTTPLVTLTGLPRPGLPLPGKGPPRRRPPPPLRPLLQRPLGLPARVARASPSMVTLFLPSSWPTDLNLATPHPFYGRDD